jgi:hypothetical protein
MLRRRRNSKLSSANNVKALAGESNECVFETRTANEKLRDSNTRFDEHATQLFRLLPVDGRDHSVVIDSSGVESAAGKDSTCELGVAGTYS